VTSFIVALRRALLRAVQRGVAAAPSRSSAVVSVPANAHSTQRFVTLDALPPRGVRRDRRHQRAERGRHRVRAPARERRSLRSSEHVIVYDLGGGTFDAALVHVAGRASRRRGSLTGVAQLGGDDFDAQLCAMALEKRRPSLPRDELAATQQTCLRECRAAKESIHANTKRVVLDLAGLGDDAPAGAGRASMVERTSTSAPGPSSSQTLDALDPLIASLPRRREQERRSSPASTWSAAPLGLPVVPRVVKRALRPPRPPLAAPRRRHRDRLRDRSPLQRRGPRRPRALSERFTRHFGVFREAERGPAHASSIPCIFEARHADAGEQGAEPARRRRAATAPMHNVGHFRFVESALRRRLAAIRPATSRRTPRSSSPSTSDARARHAASPVPIERLPR
jgi:hypothetical protein